MNPEAPHGWKAGDERLYEFGRSSGLPHGYFNRSRRLLWRLLGLFGALLVALVALAGWLA